MFICRRQPFSWLGLCVDGEEEWNEKLTADKQKLLAQRRTSVEYFTCCARWLCLLLEEAIRLMFHSRSRTEVVHFLPLVSADNLNVLWLNVPFKWQLNVPCPFKDRSVAWPFKNGLCRSRNVSRRYSILTPLATHSIVPNPKLRWRCSSSVSYR
jgi:hypothetical protein